MWAGETQAGDVGRGRHMLCTWWHQMAPHWGECRACLRRTLYSSGAYFLVWPQEVQLADNICFVFLRECLCSSVIEFLIAESHECSRELSSLITF